MSERPATPRAPRLELMTDCATEGTNFGIVTVVRGGVSNFGTEMEVARVGGADVGEALKVEAQGLRIFELQRIQRDIEGKPYFASVSNLEKALVHDRGAATGLFSLEEMVAHSETLHRVSGRWILRLVRTLRGEPWMPSHAEREWWRRSAAGGGASVHERFSRFFSASGALEDPTDQGEVRRVVKRLLGKAKVEFAHVEEVLKPVFRKAGV